ncbi:riboflavin synthase [Paucidesulfovibrio longus]|uniref:riboflavin synthase n=1 Tax=Paucidesulfovibrio longus TaxID=889 RepID=UPI000488916E|nr:riboflavin synthase [Paucidesulfovibrio longus]
MFTGLVQGVGTIEAAEARGGETRFRIRARFDLREIVKGESIAVNGVCLTVETFGQGWFTAYASRETLGVTNLGALRTGGLVNLERALALGDRLGGHMVSGHVDCLASVESVSPAGQSREYRLKFPAQFGPLVVDKGSVALDGISLTVNRCGPDWLSVNIIPATQDETTIARWTPGYQANMETDIIGRYVQRMLGAYAGGNSGTGKPEAASGLSEDFLRRHGF